MAAFSAGLALRCELAKRKMKKLGATSEETAMKPEELGIEEWVLNNNVAKYRDIKKTRNGRYYVKCKGEKHC